MNWLDGLIIVFLGITAFIGSRKGLIKTFFPLAVIVLAIFVAGHFYLSAAESSYSWIDSPSQAKIAAFILIFILVIVAALIFLWLLRKLLDLSLKGKEEMTNTIIPIAGIILGVFLAGYFYKSVADWLSGWLSSPTQSSVVAFVIIFILSMVVTTRIMLSLAALLEKRPYAEQMNRISGLGGTIMGLAIGGLISGALLTIIAKFYYVSVETTMRSSGLAAFLLNNFPFVLRILPKEFDIVRHFFS